MSQSNPNQIPAAPIIEALKDQANQVLSAALGAATLQAFDNTGASGNFPYVWQNPTNLQFNTLTYDWIDGSLKPGTAPLQFAQGTNFTNLYLQVAMDIVWSLSTADQATLNQAQASATQQQAALLNVWRSAMGSLPSGSTPIDGILQIITQTWAAPPTTLNAIQNSVNIGQLLNNTPASGQPILPALAAYLNALGSSVALQNNVTANNAYLKRAINAIQNPTAANGGLALDSGTIQPAYSVSTAVNVIENAMAPANQDANTVALDMTVMNASSSEYKVQISGSVGFDIPIFDFLTIGVESNANYFHDQMATSQNQTSVAMSFPGVNLVTFGPTAFTQAGTSSGWFWMDPVSEAIANGYPAKDVSGFKFSLKPSIDLSDAAGAFSYTSGVAISNYPTITVTVQGSNYQSIQTTFEQSVSTSVSFLGIKLASASESTYSNNVQVDAASSTVTITLSPPATLVGGTVAESIGWILGVQSQYPAA